MSGLAGPAGSVPILTGGNGQVYRVGSYIVVGSSFSNSHYFFELSLRYLFEFVCKCFESRFANTEVDRH